MMNLFDIIRARLIDGGGGGADEEAIYQEILDTFYGSGSTPAPSNFRYVEIDTLSATQNGVYNAPQNTAYSSVNVSVSGGGTQPQLNAPTITKSGTASGTTEVTINNPSTNGTYVKGYKIFLSDAYHSSTTSTTFTITDLGSYSVTVKAYGDNFQDSPASNAVDVNNYAISVSTTNCDAAIGNPTSISGDSVATLTFTANEGYEITANGITITNATVLYVNKTTGAVVIGNATGTVTMSVVASVVQTAAILTVTGLGNQDPTSVVFAEEGTFDWSIITEETVTIDGIPNYFIKIPTMYRKINTVTNNQITSFSISTAKIDNDYKPYSCFVDGNDILQYVYIGKYCFTNTSTASSVSGTAASLTIGDARTFAQALGRGYQLYDWQLQKLFVDLAMFKAKTVNLNPFGANVDDYLGVSHLSKTTLIDGIYHTLTTLYTASDPDDYSSSTSSVPIGYSALSYALPSSTNEVKSLGYDSNNPFVNYPSEVVSNSSMNTYYCDQYSYRSNSDDEAISTAIGSTYANTGLYNVGANIKWNYSGGVRLCYRPISA